MNAREELNRSAENSHLLVPCLVELRDSLGTLAVQMLAARKDLATISPSEALTELYAIISDLHVEYERIHTNLV